MFTVSLFIGIISVKSFFFILNNTQSFTTGIKFASHFSHNFLIIWKHIPNYITQHLENRTPLNEISPGMQARATCTLYCDGQNFVKPMGTLAVQHVSYSRDFKLDHHYLALNNYRNRFCSLYVPYEFILQNNKFTIYYDMM
jgi:hypothetical protein